MFIVLGTSLVCIIISILIYIGTSYDKLPNSLITLGLSHLIVGALFLMLAGGSYESYLTIRADWDATINQYRGAVEMYEDKAVLNMDKVQKSFTDFQYQGYQDNIAEAIFELRNTIISYNRTLIKKKVMNDNLIFSWLIIAPDEDMKIINILNDRNKQAAQ